MSFQDKQLKSDSAKRTEAAILAAHKKKEREAAKQGKQPFFIKKCIVLSLSPSLSLSQSALPCFFFPRYSVLLINTWQMQEKQNVSELPILESLYKEL